jgi:hypothetical protein
LFQGSYALMILLFVLAGSFVSVLPRVGVTLVLAYNAALFLMFWVFHPWKQYAMRQADWGRILVSIPEINVAMFGLSGLLLLCAFALCVWIVRALGADSRWVLESATIPFVDSIAKPTAGRGVGEVGAPDE